MKKVFYDFFVMTFVIGFFAVYISCTGCSSTNIGKVTHLRGNGDLVTSEKTVSAFKKIDCSGSTVVRFHAGEDYRTVITVDANLEDYVEVFVKNNVLRIGTKSGNYLYSFSKFLVDVYCPILTGVTRSGSGSFESVDEIITPKFDLRKSGSGRIEAKIECDDFSAQISGTGTVTVTGSSKEAKIRMSGSGNFDGNKFVIKNATVDKSGSGKANIYVEESLKVNASGSGGINYSGEPRLLSIKVSGSGGLNKSH